MQAPAFIDGVHAIADRYAGFVLDQWGVLHDGTAPYPGVLAALAELQRRNRRLVLLSNSGRRAAHSRRHLARLGFNPAMFAAIVTSGETAHTLLLHRRVPGLAAIGERCLLITRDGDREVIEGTGIVLVERIEEADFLFLAGVDSPAVGLDALRPVLEGAAARGLPCLCSNPDLVAPTRDGLILAPGGIAAAYAAMGGRVVHVGKPHAPIYGPVRDALDGLEPTEIVAVGDSLAHDIKGAKDAGFAAAFVTGGLHAEDFPADGSRAAAVGRLEALAAEHGGRPDWVMARFVW